MLTLKIANAVAAVASVAAATLALAKPTAFTHAPAAGDGDAFYARMYAARAIPLGLLAAAAPFLPALTGSPTRLILLTAATSQAADIAIAAPRREWGMVVGGSVGAAVHTIAATII